MSDKETWNGLGEWQQAKFPEPTVFELSRVGRIGIKLGVKKGDKAGMVVPKKILAEHLPELPEVSEPRVVRHFLRLSEMNYGVDTGFYPLGSCTMKYNPKINEEIAYWDTFRNIHPFQDEATIQGALQVMYELQHALCEIGGVDAVSLQPAAGAHGEFLGMLLVRAYLEDLDKGERNEVLVPDTAHGTNPASATMAGFKVVVIPTDSSGRVDLDALSSAAGPKTAALMLTNPNTLGIFESEVKEIAKIVHDAGALLYYDGANLNAILGIVRPGDMGFDIVHFNLHKTFSTPHGGGGPGGGAIGVKSHLAPYLPVPVVAKDGERYYLNYDIPKSIGKIKNFYGNFSVMLRAYVYIRIMGPDGLRKAAEMAVLNSNYLKHRILREYGGEEGYTMPYEPLRKHEFVLSGESIKSSYGVSTKDIAKRLLDYGFHAPTIYFPHLVHEALMIEPTESEERGEMEAFASALGSILEEARESKDLIATAPHNTAVKRVDEVRAARKPVLTWRMYKKVEGGNGGA